MSISRVSELAKVLADNSRVHTQFIYKTSHADGINGDVIDLSMAAGNPKFNAYVGDQTSFTPLTGSGNNGIYTGAAESGRTKYLTHWWLQTVSANNVPSTYQLLDYVGFYPLVDLDSTDIQEMDNTQTLSRHTTGEGLRMMLVVTTPSALDANFTISYTNEQGVAGRTSSGSLGVSAFTGNIRTATESTFAVGKISPFLALQDGDKGVRSIESFTMASSAGGFAVLVLVKPLAQMTLLESPTVTETDFLVDQARVIEIDDSAYLNMIFQTGSSITPAVLRGGITVARI